MSGSNTPTPAEAEEGAEVARAGLADTLSQLRENLRPSNVVDEVMASAKVNATAITDQIWDTARKNPLPALMIGAGVAMILGFGQRAVSGARNTVSGQARAQHGSSMPPRGPEFMSHISGAADAGPAQSPSLTTRATDALGSARDSAVDLLSSTNDRLSSAAARGARSLRNATSHNGSREDSTMSSYNRTRDQLSNSLTRVIEEQPLVLAAIGLAVGAAIGAAIPQTETENSLMGETSGSVRDAAQGLVQDQYAQLKSAATHAVDEIKHTVADHGVNADNLSGLVQDVGAKAKAATYDAGKALDPTSST